MLTLPDHVNSYWRTATPVARYPELLEEIEVDVAIVGAGITGLTCAYLLKKAGMKVLVLEKRTVGSGTTGRTTGKVTSQHGLRYADLYERFGEKAARAYGQANQTAVQQVAKIIRTENINAGWKRADNYVFTTEKDQVNTFKKEAEIAAKIGLPATFEPSTPLPFDVEAAVKFSGQTNIHAQKYIDGLAKAVQGNGSCIFERSNVIDIRDRKRPKVRTRKGSVIAKHIIVATNVPTLPLVARGGYCILEYPTESYIVAANLEQNLEGMYISPDDGEYSILPIRHDDESLLLIGGESHISGLRGNTKSRYQKLANYAEERFGAQSIAYRWSDRDYMSYDNIPLVGKLYPWSRNVYVATAFQKWGLTNGTVAAMVLHDQIIKRPNPWAEVFNSNRMQPIKSIPRVAFQYMSGS